MKRPQQRVAHGVEEVDKRLGGEVEQAHRRREAQHGVRRARDRDALGRQLANDHVEQRDQRKRERGGQRDTADLCLSAEQARQQFRKRGLARHAQANAGDRDPELTRGQVGVQVVDGMPHRPRARAAILLELTT